MRPLMRVFAHVIRANTPIDPRHRRVKVLSRAPGPAFQALSPGRSHRGAWRGIAQGQVSENFTVLTFTRRDSVLIP